jgi:hypothetical protein
MSYRPIERNFQTGKWRTEPSLFDQIMIKTGSFRRFKVRWAEQDFPEATYTSPVEALARLQQEREAPVPRHRIHVLDRTTGWCFSPPPRIVEDIIAGRCFLCKAERGEPCDAGLHS